MISCQLKSAAQDVKCSFFFFFATILAEHLKESTYVLHLDGGLYVEVSGV